MTTAQTPDRPAPGDPADIRRILVPTDFSAASAAALGLARSIADRFDATLQLLHVVEPPAGTGPYALNLYAPSADAVPAETLREARERLEALHRPAGSGHTSAGPVVVTGRPAAAIVDHAARHRIDLVVMGTHGRAGLSYLFLGSVAEAVVRTASCPVLTVRPRAR